MRRLLALLAVLTLAAPLMFYGCTGDDGAQGAQGIQGPPGQDLIATAKPETCAICHPGAGDAHQAGYDQLYQDGVIVISNLAYNFTGNNDVVSFNVTKAGVAADCTKLENLNIYFAPYDTATGRFQFVPAADRLSIKGTLVAGANGLCTSTNPSADNVSLATDNGVIIVYGYDELVGRTAARVRQVKYPYAALLTEGTVDYASAANVSGCEKCHTVPYLKHGNIYGQVGGDPATDFITCKACHLDNGEGGHQVWQLLVDDTARAGELWAIAPGDVESEMTPAELAKYAYTTRLMNDVHMSHAMEFEYPQSMANCATCHAGKLSAIFADPNFVVETCKSCHAVTGSAQSEKPQPALADILPASHFTAGVVTRVNCFSCHTAGSGLSTFTDFHTGYDKKIYADAAGTKYADNIVVTIDNASFNDNTYQLTFGFSATGTAGGLNAADIAPTVLVGLYGYDTKDYIVGPHERSIDSNRDLEYAAGATHPRFQTVSSGGGAWVIQADLSAWAGIIDNGAVRRVEIGVMPRLLNADNVVVALNAPSRTYSLAANAFVNFYSPIVNVAAGCNNCHDALATTFHSADRGGNIVVCRLCHITKSGGSHLEMQSRSIDSYAHSIHSFQAFDIGDVNFDNAVQSMFYDLKTESTYPVFGLTDCRSCHTAGKFNVPDQAKSLPGILSGSDTLQGKTRTINGIPAYVTGPASRACGACHRAEMIKEDLSAEFSAFNQHTKDGGYLLVPGNIATMVSATDAILPMFYDGILVTLP